MKIVKMKTSELSGPALDWAVAIAENLGPEVSIWDDGEVFIMIKNTGQRKPFGAGRRISHTTRERRLFGLIYLTGETLVGWEFCPTMDWSQIRRHLISLKAPLDSGGDWEASAYGISATASDIGPACCRAIVAAKLGDEVEVPEKLCTH